MFSPGPAGENAFHEWCRSFGIRDIIERYGAVYLPGDYSLIEGPALRSTWAKQAERLDKILARMGSAENKLSGESGL